MLLKFLDSFTKGSRTVRAEGTQSFHTHIPVIGLGHDHQQETFFAGVQLIVIDERIVHDGIASVSGNLELDYGHVLVLLIQVVESKKQHDISSCCLTGLLGFLQLLLPVPDSH